METLEVIVIVQGITLTVVVLAHLCVCAVLALRRRPADVRVSHSMARHLVDSYNNGRHDAMHGAEFGVDRRPPSALQEDESPMPPEVPDEEIVNVTEAWREG